MPLATLKLFGGFELRVGSDAPLALPAKARALAAYLAIRPDTYHLRDKLAALLWGESGDTQARDSLRHAITQLRTALTAGDRCALASARQAFAMDGSLIESDVVAFERLASAPDTASWEDAVDAYRGQLLEGLVINAPAFEEWLLPERERLREIAIETLGRLVAHHAACDRLDTAVQYATRLLALDPLQEPAHRALMRLYARQGRRAAALRQYQTCVDVMRRELGMEPDPETKRTYRDIVSAPEPAIVPSAPDAAAVPLDVSKWPLVGRDAELARLLAACAASDAGKGQVAIVLGEAGLGKSRLVSELVALTAGRDATVLFGKAYESERLLPFAVWIHALRSSGVFAGERPLQDFDPAWRSELGRLFPELGGSGAARPASTEDHTHLFEALVRLLAHLAARRPLLLILEDLHWADAMSVRLLAFVARRASALRVLVLATARDEEIADATELRTAIHEVEHDAHVSLATLAPLSREQVASLVSASGPRTPHSPDTLDAVWRLSEGNPFVALETMQAIQEGGTPVLPARMNVPERVRTLIQGRLERLTPRARQLVGAAAVIGRDFDFPLLRESAGMTDREAADGLEELVRRRLVRLAGDGFAFTHDRIRRAAYDELLPPQRAAFHLHTARAIERLYGDRGDDIDERLGYHYAQTDEAERAVEHLARAAHHAGRRFALTDAVAALDQALALVPRLPAVARDRVHLELLVSKADFLVYLGRFPDVMQTLDAHTDLVDRVGDARLEGRYRFWLALPLSLMGQHDAAIAHARRALDAATVAGDPSTQGRALSVLALVAFWSSRPVEGVEFARDAVEHLTAAGDDEWLSIGYFYLAVNAVQWGDLDAATEANRMAAIVADRADSPRLKTFAAWSTGWAMTTRGDAMEGVSACLDAVRLAPDPLGTANANGFLGHARLEAGDAAGARAALEIAIALSAQFGFRPQEGWFSAWLAEAHLATGDVVRARELADTAIAIARQVAFPFGVAVALRAAGRAALAAGDSTRAAALLREALTTFEAIPARAEIARTPIDPV